MNGQNIKSILTYLNPNLLGNILTVNHHLAHKHHVEAIVKEKGLCHPSLVCPRGQKYKTGYSGLSPPIVHMDKTSRCKC